jgi:hypothetical protein
MIISHKYKIIYIRIPKTGSTSIEKFFKIIDPECIISNNNSPPYGHYTSEIVKNMVTDEQWETYYKISIFRNPVDWFISFYKDISQYSYHQYNNLKILLNNNNSLDIPPDNILKPINVTSLYILLNKWFDFKNQISFIKNIDYVEIYDNYNLFLKNICKHINIEYKDEYNIHLNKSNLDNVHCNYDSINIIRILYKDDIELYENIKYKVK